MSESRKRLINQHKEKRHEICIDDGSTNIKLAWTENGERPQRHQPEQLQVGMVCAVRWHAARELHA
ncbi:plasmid segregation protein ParM domain-containing protein [Escherichia coli]|uniref:plasmid segregation protein ParM domain-containing protein n=1 Tax=Escherichia coli TaxID=562 RepID=UPI0032B7AFE5